MSRRDYSIADILEGVSDQLDYEEVSEAVIEIEEYRKSTPASKQKYIKTLNYLLKEQITLLIEETNEIKLPVISKGNKVNESKVLLLSDWHLGQKSTKAGKILFDKRLAKEKKDTLIKNVLEVIKYSEYQRNVDELVICLLGDMVENEIIFKGQTFRIEETVQDQIMSAAYIIQEALVTLEQLGIPMKIYCVPGNHGRTDNVSGSPSNWDTVLYNMLKMTNEARFKEMNKRTMEFHIADCDYLNIDVKGHPGYLRHILPSQGQTPSARAKLGAWHSLHGYEWAAGGHWHVAQHYEWEGKEIFINGSLVGYNEFGESIGRVSPPRQWFFGVTEKRIPTDEWKIDLK